MCVGFYGRKIDESIWWIINIFDALLKHKEPFLALALKTLQKTVIHQMFLWLIKTFFKQTRLMRRKISEKKLWRHFWVLTPWKLKKFSKKVIEWILWTWIRNKQINSFVFTLLDEIIKCFKTSTRGTHTHSSLLELRTV